MKVIGLIPKTKKVIPATDTEEATLVPVPGKILLEATEEEVDKISGILNTEHIKGRIKVGHEITVSKVYDKLEDLVQNKTKLTKAVIILRDAADGIEAALPKE